MLGVTTPPKAAERLPSPHTRPPLKGPLASKRELTVSIPADELECGSAATIHVAVAGRILKGEDKHAVLRATVGGERLLLCLVADGHGGNAASTHAAAYLLRYVVEEADGDASGPGLEEACARAFDRVHHEVIAVSGCTAGCTATVCIVNEAREEIICANVGDSAAALLTSTLTHSCGADASTSTPTPESSPEQFRSPDSVRSSINFSSSSRSTSPPLWARRSRRKEGEEPGPLTVVLTCDHRLQTNGSERDRVSGCGGVLHRVRAPDGQPYGPLRAWPGGLAIARCLGDADCLSIVSPQPATRTHPFSSQSSILIVASDGVWDMATTNRVVGLANKSSSPKSAASRIVGAAAITGVHDDITCLVIMPTRVMAAHEQRKEQRSPINRIKSLNPLRARAKAPATGTASMSPSPTSSRPDASSSTSTDGSTSPTPSSTPTEGTESNRQELTRRTTIKLALPMEEITGSEASVPQRAALEP